jgi:hypothetical protein
MTTPKNDPLESIDRPMLTRLARRALNCNTAEIVDWQSSPLYGGGHNSEIFRFSGNASDQGVILPWSLILKIIRRLEGEENPLSLRYWKREALVYRSGLLDDLPGRIRAPRCYEVTERPENEVWLWQEDIVDDIKGKWSLDQYGIVARHVGEFNGIFFENQPAFSRPWMMKHQLRAWVGDEAPVLPPEVLAHPWVARFCPGDIYLWMQGVWADHDTWLGILEHQPQTLSHLDVFRRNAFARRSTQGDLETVLIDWAFVGSATPGEEIAPLVAGSVNFLEFDPNQTRELDQVVFDGYLEGLRSAGWRGDPRIVRFAYAAGSVLKFSVGVYGVAFMLADESQQPVLEQIFGHPADQLVDVWRSTFRFLTGLSGEVRELTSQFM